MALINTVFMLLFIGLAVHRLYPVFREYRARKQAQQKPIKPLSREERRQRILALIDRNIARSVDEDFDPDISQGSRRYK